MRFSPFLLSVFLAAAAARADVALLSGTEAVSVIYRDGANVIYQRCAPGHALGINRKTCSKPTGTLSVPYVKYVKRLAALHKVHSTFSDLEGLKRASQRIELITRDLERLAAGTERVSAETLLGDLRVKQRQLLAVKSDILDFLPEQNDTTVDGNYRAIYRTILDALAPVWYDDTKYVWKIGVKESVGFFLNESCPPPWQYPASFEEQAIVGPNRLTVQEALGRTEIAEAIGERWVWMAGDYAIRRLGQPGSGDATKMHVSWEPVNWNWGDPRRTAIYPVLCVQ